MSPHYRLGHQDRALYRQWGSEPADSDEFVGVLFPPAVAHLAVDALNNYLAAFDQDGAPPAVDGPYHAHGCHNLHCGQLQVGCLFTPAATELLCTALNWFYYHGEPE